VAGRTGAQEGFAAIAGAAAGAVGRVAQSALQRSSPGARSGKARQVTGNDKE
jgi:hypothetical protein